MLTVRILTRLLYKKLIQRLSVRKTLQYYVPYCGCSWYDDFIDKYVRVLYESNNAHFLPIFAYTNKTEYILEIRVSIFLLK